MTTSFGLNSFVCRQTAESKFSHYEGPLEHVINLVMARWDDRKPGYKDGVVLVSVPAEGFRCGVVELTPTSEIRAIFEARREGEDPFVSILAKGEKAQAKYVEIVLYASGLLRADDSESTTCEWEIVSINARPTEEEEPQTPMAMARNFLNRPGGTAAYYTAEDFAKAILYWSKRAMVDPG